MCIFTAGLQQTSLPRSLVMYSIKPGATVWRHYVISGGYWAGRPAEGIALPASRASLRSDHRTNGADFTWHSFSPPQNKPWFEPVETIRGSVTWYTYWGCVFVEEWAPPAHYVHYCALKRQRTSRLPGHLWLREQALMLTRLPVTLHMATPTDFLHTANTLWVERDVKEAVHNPTHSRVDACVRECITSFPSHYCSFPPR